MQKVSTILNINQYIINKYKQEKSYMKIPNLNIFINTKTFFRLYRKQIKKNKIMHEKGKMLYLMCVLEKNQQSSKQKKFITIIITLTKK